MRETPCWPGGSEPGTRLETVSDGAYLRRTVPQQDDAPAGLGRHGRDCGRRQAMLEARQVTGYEPKRHGPKLGEFGHAGDDHVVPFEVSELDVRGRAVQLVPMLDAILSR